MTLKVIGFKEYVYICISLHSVGLKVFKENILILLLVILILITGRKRGPHVVLWGRLFLWGTVFNEGKNAYPTEFPNITELSTFAYEK